MQKDTLEKVAYLMRVRIENMQNQDKLDGKTNATLEDYLHWSLEEVEANDGVVISLVSTCKGCGEPMEGLVRIHHHTNEKGEDITK